MFGKKVKTEIKVDGMHCAHCAAKVEAALKALDGVKSVKVDLNSKNVEIVSGEELDMAKVGEAVSSAGFSVIA